jgi:hypothetical protein
MFGGKLSEMLDILKNKSVSINYNQSYINTVSNELEKLNQENYRLKDKFGFNISKLKELLKNLKEIYHYKSGIGKVYTVLIYNKQESNLSDILVSLYNSSFYNHNDSLYYLDTVTKDDDYYKDIDKLSDEVEKLFIQPESQDGGVEEVTNNHFVDIKTYLETLINNLHYIVYILHLIDILLKNMKIFHIPNQVDLRAILSTLIYLHNECVPKIKLILMNNLRIFENAEKKIIKIKDTKEYKESKSALFRKQVRAHIITNLRPEHPYRNSNKGNYSHAPIHIKPPTTFIPGHPDFIARIAAEKLAAEKLAAEKLAAEKLAAANRNTNSLLGRPRNSGYNRESQGRRRRRRFFW